MFSSKIYCMIMHEYANIFDEDIVSFVLFSYQQQINMSFESISWHIDWIFSLVFITKNTNTNSICFLDFVKIFSFGIKLYIFRIKLSCKIFQILLGLWCAGFKYLILTFNPFIIRVVLVHYTQSNDSWFSDTRFMHKYIQKCLYFI